jgi:hypothetical protein
VATAAFVEAQGRRVYRMLHHAEAPVRGSVVICPPLANEWASSQRVLVNVARHLSSVGWSVCRFDYCATGESPGALEDCDFESFVDSAVSVVESSAARPRVLIAVRAAALFIDAVLGRVSDVSGVLWVDPVFDGADYVKELKLAAALGGLQDGTSLGQREEAGLDVGSFVFSARLLRQLAAVAGGAAAPGGTAASAAVEAGGPVSRAIVCTLPPKARVLARAASAQVYRVTDLPRFWAKKDQFRSPQLEAAIATWLHPISGGRDA